MVFRQRDDEFEERIETTIDTATAHCSLRVLKWMHKNGWDVLRKGTMRWIETKMGTYLHNTEAHSHSADQYLGHTAPTHVEKLRSVCDTIEWLVSIGHVHWNCFTFRVLGTMNRFNTLVKVAKSCGIATCEYESEIVVTCIGLKT